MTRDEAAAALREQRLGRGLSVEDVAKATLLKGRIIEEFETGRESVLDGYHKSYLRRYADFLGVDGTAILAAYTGNTAAQEPSQGNPAVDEGVHERRLGRRASIFRRKRPFIPAAVASVLIVVLAVGLLAHPPSFLVPERPSDTGPVEEKPPATDTTPVDPAPEPDSGAEPAITTLKFMATGERAWLEIRVDGRIAFSGTLRPGETAEAAGNHVIVIFGNAMHTQVAVNGQDKGLVSSDRTVLTQEYGTADSDGL